jgi:hypothetical protein
MSVPITVSVLRISTKLPARYMSWNMSARSRMGPVVGMFMTIATSASPEMMAGSIQPIVLTSGLMATRTGYLNKSLPSGSPLARAVTTYCLFSSSSRVARRTRMRPAVPARPRMTIGTQMWESMFSTLGMLHAASANLEENSPVIAMLNFENRSQTTTRAIRNPGVASPMNPMKVQK